MTKQQVNVRLSEGTREKLDYLTTRYGTQVEAVAVAIEFLYSRDTAKTAEQPGEAVEQS